MKFLIFESNEIHPDALKLLERNGFQTQTELNSADNKKEIGAFFIRSYTRITPALLDDFPNLKYILRAGVGLENVDLDACKKRGIEVVNSPGSNANSVSELTICFMILLNRKIKLQVELLRNKSWRDKENIGSELKNKTIGLIGCGAIGRLVAKKLLAFEVKKILAFDPYLDEKILASRHTRKCELDDLLQESDIITLHLPLNSETRGMINKEKLTLSKKGAVIINTSRGGIINELDLIEALKNKRLCGAALDVFENEPDFRPELLELPNVILTPHIGGFSKEADLEMAVQAVKNFLKLFRTTS